MTMSDRYEEVLKHYPLQVKTIRKDGDPGSVIRIRD